MIRFCLKILFPLLPAIFIIYSAEVNSFEKQQRRYPRVRAAFAEKADSVKALFTGKGLSYPPREIFLRAFKLERELDLWAKDSNCDTFTLVKTYDFCTSSGTPGPKRRQGDLQIPEGFYHINKFNPYSNFHLSLGINYPNQSDRMLGVRGNLGGDIFIHGSCVTIGCIPITDDKIKELYIIAVMAKSSGQTEIPVHIFPAKLSKSRFAELNVNYSGSPSLIAFWQNLREGYNYFEKFRKLPAIGLNGETGLYEFNR